MPDTSISVRPLIDDAFHPYYSELEWFSFESSDVQSASQNYFEFVALSSLADSLCRDEMQFL